MTRDNKPAGRGPARGTHGAGLPPVAWVGLAGLVLVLVGLILVRQSLAGPGPAVGSAPAQVSGKPKLAVDRETIDFGRVPLDKPVKATFRLTNAGDKPLAINGTPEVQAVKGC